MGEIPKDGQPMANGVPGFDATELPPASVEAGLPTTMPTGYEGFGEDAHAQAVSKARDKAVQVGSEAVGGKPDDKDRYGYLFDPDTPDDKFGVDKAAVKPDSGSQSLKSPAQTSDRPGYFKPATQEQIDEAAKYGFNLTEANDKYYPGWEEKNNG